VTIGLGLESFKQVSGIFVEVYAGKLTAIVVRF
jgi:hypothetical protein